MFILGTSSVLAFVDGAAINLIGPTPQTFSRAFGGSGWGRFGAVHIFLLLARAVASTSLIFTLDTIADDRRLGSFAARLVPTTASKVEDAGQFRFYS